MAFMVGTWGEMQAMLKIDNWGGWCQLLRFIQQILSTYQVPGGRLAPGKGKYKRIRRWLWSEGTCGRRGGGASIEISQESDMKSRSFIYFLHSVKSCIRWLRHSLKCSEYKDKWNWSLPPEATVHILNQSHPGRFSKYRSPGPQPRHSDSECLEVMPKKSEAPILGALQIWVLVLWGNKWREPETGRKASWPTSIRKPSLANLTRVCMSWPQPLLNIPYVLQVF